MWCNLCQKEIGKRYPVEAILLPDYGNSQRRTQTPSKSLKKSIFRFCEIYWEYARSSKSIKIGKSDLIDIDCIDQSVEIDDTLISFFDVFKFYRFHRFLSEADICSSVHPKMKTDFMQTVNLLTIELQVRVEGSNNLLSLFKKSFKKSYLFFKTHFKVFFGWPIMARFFIFPSFWPFRNLLSKVVFLVVLSCENC